MLLNVAMENTQRIQRERERERGSLYTIRKRTHNTSGNNITIHDAQPSLIIIIIFGCVSFGPSCKRCSISSQLNRMNRLGLWICPYRDDDACRVVGKYREIIERFFRAVAPSGLVHFAVC